MNQKNSIMTILFCSALAVFIWITPTTSFADNTSITQIQEKTLLIAQAQEQSNQKESSKTTEKKLSKERDGGCCPGNGMHGHMMMKHAHSYAHMIASYAEALQLSDEQLGKIVRLHMQGTKEHKKIKEKMHKSHKDFLKAAMQPGTDDATLVKLGKAHTDAFNEMVEYSIKERKTIHDLLTPDQMNKLKSMKMHHDKQGSNHGSSGHNH